MNPRRVAVATMALVLVVVLGAWIVVGYMETKDIEEPAYTVVEEKADYEIRLYEPQLRAEVTIEGAYRESLYAGFPILASFIFGNNSAQKEISMTAPVISETVHKIAMTAPVMHEVQEKGNRHVIAFVMPAEFSLETLPKPVSDDVIIREIGKGRVAAVRFGGYATEGRSNRRISELKAALERDGVPMLGEAQIAQYNPPWTPPFMRRNEILIPVE